MKRRMTVIVLAALLLLIALSVAYIVIKEQKTDSADATFDSQITESQATENQTATEHKCNLQKQTDPAPDDRVLQNKVGGLVDYSIYEPFATIAKRIGKTQTDRTALDIPLYCENDLLYDTGMMFHLQLDSCLRPINSCPNEAYAVLYRYPTNAIRIRGDNTVYSVYDTDSGYRFYLFFKLDGFPTTIGFPIVIKNMLCSTCFQDVKVGDPIEKVEAIDDVTTLHKKTILDVLNESPVSAKADEEQGDPCASLHYLVDGLLKINYTMLEDRSLVVSEILFYEDYQVINAKGEKVNHKIEDIDLPIR